MEGSDSIMIDVIIDTSTDALVCAVLAVSKELETLKPVSLLHVPEIVSQLTIPTMREHMELLIPHIAAMFNEHHISSQDVHALIVGTGPGPYTGLRVGLASAIALAHSWDKPLYSANALAALAWGCYRDIVSGGDDSVYEHKLLSSVDESLSNDSYIPGYDILALLDARRKEWYWAGFHFPKSEWKDPGEMMRTACLESFTGYHASSPRDIDFSYTHIVCPSKIAQQLSEFSTSAIIHIRDHPFCGDLWAVSSGDGSIAGVQPTYCRRPDAQPSTVIKKVIPSS